jgi:hypothetical protein
MSKKAGVELEFGTARLRRPAWPTGGSPWLRRTSITVSVGAQAPARTPSSPSATENPSVLVTTRDAQQPVCSARMSAMCCGSDEFRRSALAFRSA